MFGKISTIGAKWFIFTVVLSFLPLVAIAHQLDNRGLLTNVSQTWESGELFLLTVAIATGAIGDMIAIQIKPQHKTWATIANLVSGGILVAMVFLASVQYADLTALKLTGNPKALEFMRTQSPYYFGVTLFCGLASLVTGAITAKQ